MTQILPLAEIRRGLAQASGLPAMLSASLDAFEAMLTLLREQEDPPGPGFAAFALAAASAANGRDAIAFAPSPPPAGPGQVGPAPKVPHTSLPAATVAADLGELALALADYRRMRRPVRSIPMTVMHARTAPGMPLPSARC